MDYDVKRNKQIGARALRDSTLSPREVAEASTQQGSESGRRVVQLSLVDKAGEIDGRKLRG